jgi:alkanesulfonate monooxygenase SsuD/methylene tetrahydromethanopterin reductase-like flavin-dependent oxidoreductase (luciferase family)
VKVGITLPQFRDTADEAVAAARRAEELGIDGVFCFDHLWPMGQPGRPALSSAPLLGALAAATGTVALGTLVARVGLLPDDVLVETLASLQRLAAGRLIAGLGTGDRLSRGENDAFGVPYDTAEVRRDRLAAVAVAVAARGIPVWVGGGSASTTGLARTVGGAVNLWEAEPGRVAELAGQGYEVTWGGPVDGTVPGAVSRLRQVQAAGASWAVCAWPDSLDVVARAAAAVR